MRILRWFFEPAQPRCYAVLAFKEKDGLEYKDGRWIKVVTYKEPRRFNGLIGEVVGPFRSEVDCDDFCDQANTSIVTPRP